MNKEEAIRMLKAKLECMTRDVSGRDSDCINRRCDECSLNYEQGNMGEQKEWLRMAIKALEPQPKERTEEGTETHACDYISRKLMMDMGATCIAARNEDGDLVALGALDILPSATPQPKVGHWILSGGFWRCSECKEKALLKLDRATGGYREYEPVRSKYCPECGIKMQEVQ